MKNSVYPLIKISEKQEMILFLIQEELKSRKLFQGLREAGLEDCYYQPHLDLLILKLIGIDDGSDETFSHYNDIIEKRSRKIQPDRKSVMKQAMKVWRELEGMK